MSGHAHAKKDREKPCWHDAEKKRSLVTAARREAMRQMALDDPAEFVRCLHSTRFVSLAQLPWWTAFAQTYRWEAAEIVLLAAEVGIGTR